MILVPGGPPGDQSSWGMVALLREFRWDGVWVAEAVEVKVSSPSLKSQPHRMQTVNWMFGLVPWGCEAKAGLDTRPGIN